MKGKELYFSTVSVLLKDILFKLMHNDLFQDFRLVGGTNLSLRYGHRKSVDIDLFTDKEYGSVGFNRLEDYLKSEFKYYDCPDPSNIVGFGRSYYVGESARECVKLDLMYTDSFISPIDNVEGIRFAAIQDLMAMKLNAINHGARKKDFWDLHLLLEHFDINYMIDMFKIRHSWEFDINEIKRKLVDFREIDDDFNPICMKNKDWDIIKLDIVDAVKLIKG